MAVPSEKKKSLSSNQQMMIRTPISNKIKMKKGYEVPFKSLKGSFDKKGIQSAYKNNN